MKKEDINFQPFAGAESDLSKSYLLINKTIEPQNTTGYTAAVRVVIYNSGEVDIFNELKDRLGNYLTFGYYPIIFSKEGEKEKAIETIMENCDEMELKMICDSLK